MGVCFLCVCDWSEVQYGLSANDVRQSNHRSRLQSSYKGIDITEGKKNILLLMRPAVRHILHLSFKSTYTSLPSRDGRTKHTIFYKK